MLAFPLMLWVKLLVVQIIHPQSNKFVSGVENKATHDSELNDSPKKGLEGLLETFKSKLISIFIIKTDLNFV